MKIGIYFLFYVAMILELLIFIVDRDEANARLKTTYDEITRGVERSYTSRLVVSVQDTLEAARSSSVKRETTTGVVSVAGLWSANEWEDLRFHIIARDSSKWRSETYTKVSKNIIGGMAIVSDTTGHIAVFTDLNTGAGLLYMELMRDKDSVGVFCETCRDIPKYFPPELIDHITANLESRLVGNVQKWIVRSDTAWFVTKIGGSVHIPWTNLKGG